MNIYSHREIDGTDSVFIEIKDWLSPDLSMKIKKHLDDIDDWKHGNLWGKSICRLQKWFHDDGRYFSDFWHDQTHARWMSHDHDEWLIMLRDMIQTELNHIFLEIVPKFGFAGCNLPSINSTLLNYYRDGGDIIRHHRDDEKIFGDNPSIAMLTFGAVRPLDFARSTFMPDAPYDISPNPHESHLNRCYKVPQGSLFIMMGSVQKYYTHGIQKDASVVDSRYSITFREHKNKKK
jgi:hypothetical protein